MDTAIQASVHRVRSLPVPRAAWLIIPAALAVGLALVQTRFGPGASGDSVHYLMGAQSLIAGNGYSRVSGGGELRPITGFPALYSLVLAGLGATGLDLIDAAGGLNVVLFGMNAFLLGLIILRHTHSIPAAPLGAVLFLASDSVPGPTRLGDARAIAYLPRVSVASVADGGSRDGPPEPTCPARDQHQSRDSHSLCWDQPCHHSL